MGTSASHGGSKPGVSFDPPWLNDIDNPEHIPDSKESPPEQLLAPPARFRRARLSLGDYVKSGSRDSLRKALGHYSRTGMGGAQNVANRMRHSASVASKLYSSFSSLREGNEPTISSIISNYRAENTDIYGMIDAIAGYICGDGGSLDEASPLNSVSSALSDLFDKNPDVDIANLSDDSVWSLVSSFLSYEAFSKVQLDIGRSFEAKDTPLVERITRLKDMREYLEAEISAQINIIRNELSDRQPSNLHKVMMTAIKRTFEVFEVTV